jgi:hypothetical protein
MGDPDQQRRPKPAFDQHALNYAPSEFGSSIYNSTTSGEQKSTQDDDVMSRASVYTYYSTADRARLTRQVAGRVSLLKPTGIKCLISQRPLTLCQKYTFSRVVRSI